jgi:hypothetical protein
MHLFIYVRIQCFLTPVSGSGIGMEKNSRSGINIPDHISQNLVENLGVRYLNSLLRIRIRDPRFGAFLTLDTHPGSATLGVYR